MSDIDNDVELTSEELALEGLRAQLDARGIKYHHKAKAETLQDLLKAAHEKEAPTPESNINVGDDERVRLQALRSKALLMRRVMVTCNDPMKLKWCGEIFQGGNSAIGVVKKYVPFGNPNGWFVPEILLTVIKEKQFRRQNTKENDPMSGGLAPTYTVTYLDELSPKELADLKHRQALANAREDHLK